MSSKQSIPDCTNRSIFIEISLIFTST